MTTSPTISTNQPTDDSELLAELGALVFESALAEYIATVDEKQALAFNAYIGTHAEDPDLIEKVCAAYPDFTTSLQAEYVYLQEQMKELLPEGK